MKYLVNDKRNCEATELVSAELKTRLNATLPTADMYRYILLNQDLLKAIRSDEKYTFKKNMFIKFIYLFHCFFLIFVQ